MENLISPQFTKEMYVKKQPGVIAKKWHTHVNLEGENTQIVVSENPNRE